MENKTQYLREETVDLVSDTFGEETARLFNLFCEGKPAKEIVIFLREILNEFFGDTKTSEIIEYFREKYSV